MRLLASLLLPLLLITPSLYAGETPDAQATINAMSTCRKEPAALERLD